MDRTTNSCYKKTCCSN